MPEPFIQPYLVANDVDESLAFYQALGFATIRNETFPYRFAEVKDGELWLLMSSLAQFGGKKSFGAFIVTIPDLLDRYARYTDSLRASPGGIPLQGRPRITRLARDAGQFRVFDPAGNMLVFMAENYNPPAYTEPANAVEDALTTAGFDRDIYANDAIAAKVLDRAIAAISAKTDALGRARLIGARAELAVAMGDMTFIEEYEPELESLSLQEDCAPYREALFDYRQLARWMKHPV